MNPKRLANSSACAAITRTSERSSVNRPGAVQVTGAARGIGAAIAVELASQGAQVVGWDQTASADYPENVASKICLHQVDLTDKVALKSAAASLFEQGPLDILVNNAGIQGATSPIGEQDDDTWSKVISINLTAVFRVSRLIAPKMQARGYGRIVNVASTAGLRGVPNAVSYSASKGGVIALTMALAKELFTAGVTVNCVAPGLIETDLLSQMSQDYIDSIVAKMPMGRMGQPQEVAAMVAWAASPACSFTTGAVFDVSGGRLIS